MVKVTQQAPKQAVHTKDLRRWLEKRSPLVVGVLLAVGTSLLAACAGNPSDSTGTSALAGQVGSPVVAPAGSQTEGNLSASPSTSSDAKQQAARKRASGAADPGAGVINAGTVAGPVNLVPASPGPATGSAGTNPSGGAANPGTSAPSTGTGSNSGSGASGSTDPSGANPASSVPGFALKYVQEFTGGSLPSGWDAYSGGDNGPQATDSEAHFDPGLCQFSGGEAHFMASGVDSCGIHYQGVPQKYGAWFARLKGDSLPASAIFTDIFLLWPDNGVWPPEIDIYEDGGDRSKTSASVYNTVSSVCGSSPTPPCLEPYEQSNGSKNGVANDDLAWHTYGVEWTPSGVNWYIDGKVVFSAPANQVKAPAQQPAEPMDMDLQVQSLGSGISTKTETMAVDWVQQFSWNG